MLHPKKSALWDTGIEHATIHQFRMGLNPRHGLWRDFCADQCEMNLTASSLCSHSQVCLTAGYNAWCFLKTPLPLLHWIFFKVFFRWKCEFIWMNSFGGFSPKTENKQDPGIQIINSWWFQKFIIFIPTWGRFPFWLIFFRWVETTNQNTYD